MKPRMFIGSSVEGLELARAIQEGLDYDLDSQVWDQGTFEPSHYTLECLASELDEYDFAAFVFQPEDITIIRGEQTFAVRDNVVFELGMFIGHLGRKRVFIILPRDSDLRIATDLHGLTFVDYDPTKATTQGTLGSGLNKIRRQCKSLGVTDSRAIKNNARICAVQGLPAAGKSTIVGQFSVKTGYPYVQDYDSFKILFDWDNSKPTELGERKDRQSNYAELEKKRAFQACRLLERGNTILYDLDFLSILAYTFADMWHEGDRTLFEWQIEQYLSMVQSNDAVLPHEYLFLDVSLDNRKERAARNSLRNRAPEYFDERFSENMRAFFWFLLHPKSESRVFRCHWHHHDGYTPFELENVMHDMFAHDEEPVPLANLQEGLTSLLDLKREPYAEAVNFPRTT